MSSKAKSDEKVIVMRWSRPQSRALQTTTRYVDLEGAIRAGKTTVLVWKAITWLQNNPGCYGLLTRWTQDSLDAQLKPEFWKHCPREILARKPWHGQEEYVAFENGSRMYLRAMKSSDESARYVKTSGLTFGFIGIDQPEEMPRDIFAYLKGRLSQPGMPQQMMITPNPPDLDHWLCKEFPTDKPRSENYELITFTIYDNAHNLSAEYIEALEEDFPPTHPMHRRLLLGQRGAAALGTPVYGKVFRREIHVKPDVEPVEEVAILEGWDFSFSHPAVSWTQVTPWGSWSILGEIQGEDEYLEDFIPRVRMALRAILPPQFDGIVQTTCDPSGAVPTSHGSRKTAVNLLNEAGIYPFIVPNANRPAQRVYAVQQIAKLMLRLTPEGPALQVHPRCRRIIDGFQVGYTYPEKPRLVQGLQVPFKDGIYDHLQNTLEYQVLAFLAPQYDTNVVGSPLHVDEDGPQHRDNRRRRGAGLAGY